MNKLYHDREGMNEDLAEVRAGLELADAIASGRYQGDAEAEAHESWLNGSVALGRIEFQLTSLTEESEKLDKECYELRESLSYSNPRAESELRRQIQVKLSEAEQRAARYEAVVEAAREAAKMWTGRRLKQNYAPRLLNLLLAVDALSPIDPPLGQGTEKE